MPVKTQPRPHLLSLALLALLITSSAAAAEATAKVDIPAEALSRDAVAVFYFDAQAVDADTIRDTFDFFVKRWPGKLYLREVVGDMKSFTKTATEIDAMLLVIGVPVADPSVGMPLSLLIRPNPGVTAEQASPVEIIWSAVGRGPATKGLKLAKFANGWFVLRQTGLDDPRGAEYRDPTGATEPMTAWFNRTLNKTGDRPVKFAFRMTEPLKELYRDLAGYSARKGPWRRRLSKVYETLAKSQSGWVAAGLGGQPDLAASLKFAEADPAKEFKKHYESLLSKLPDPMPPPFTGSSKLTPAAQMQRSGSTLSTTLTASEIGGMLGPAERPGLNKLQAQGKAQAEREAK